MFRTIAWVAALVLSGSISAHAADMAMKGASPMAPTPAYNWTGWYLGAGGGFMNGTATGNAVAFVSNASGTVGFVAVEGGYRYQTPSNFVLGIDVTAPVWAGTVSITPQPLGTGFDSAKPEFIVLPTIQVGYAFGQWLPYLGFGVGVADIKATTQTFGVGGLALFSDTETSPVYDFAVGVDYALTYNWIVGLRYDHLISPDRSYSFATGPTPTVQQVGAYTDGVTAMVKYRF